MNSNLIRFCDGFAKTQDKAPIERGIPESVVEIYSSCLAALRTLSSIIQVFLSCSSSAMPELTGAFEVAASSQVFFPLMRVDFLVAGSSVIGSAGATELDFPPFFFFPPTVDLRGVSFDFSDSSATCFPEAILV